MNNLDLNDYKRIRVLEVMEVRPGTEPVRDSAIAHFPTKIRWCPVEIDKHVALAAKETLTQVDVVKVSSYSPTFIIEGIYDVVEVSVQEKVFIYEDAAA